MVTWACLGWYLEERTVMEIRYTVWKHHFWTQSQALCIYSQIFPRPYSVKPCSRTPLVPQMEENGDVQEISHMAASLGGRCDTPPPAAGTDIPAQYIPLHTRKNKSQGFKCKAEGIQGICQEYKCN